MATLMKALQCRYMAMVCLCVYGWEGGGSNLASPQSYTHGMAGGGGSNLASPPPPNTHSHTHTYTQLPYIPTP